MRLEIAERLRCPRDHEPSPLILVASTVNGRDLRRGALGCPVCRLEARVEDGDAWFGDEGPEPVRPGSEPPRNVLTDDPESVDRLLALLGLAEPGGGVLLTGRYAAVADSVARTSDVAIVVMHAADRPTKHDAVACVHGETGRVPFADATFRGAALDAALPQSFTADAVRAVALGGRIVGQSVLAVPTGVRELARDALEWVGERVALAPIVQIGRPGGR